MKTNKCISYSYLFIATQAFAIGYVYRGSFAPLTDVLEEELNTTSAGIGLASSVVYGAYAFMQIPYGLMLNRIQPQFILCVCLFGLAITSFLFPLSENVSIATIINAFSGVFIAPAFIIQLNLTIQVLGNQYVGLLVGFTLLQANITFLSTTTIQAYVYQTISQWEWVYYLVTIYCLVSGSILFMLMSYESYHVNISSNIKSDNELDSMGMAEAQSISDTNNDKTPLINPVSKGGFWNRLIFVTQNGNDDGNQLSLCAALKATATNYLNYVNGLYGFGILTVMLSFNGLWLISYMMLKFDYSRELASFISGTFFIVNGIGAVVYGKLSLKFKQRKPLLVSGVLLMIGSLYIIYCKPDTSMFLILILNMLSGFGCGAQAVLFTMIKEFNEYNNCTKIATGYTNTMVTCTGFITQFLMGDLLDIAWKQRNGAIDDNGVRIYTVSDYDFAFIVIPISLGLALILALVIRETFSKSVDYSKPNKLCRL